MQVNILKKHIRWLLPVVIMAVITPLTPFLDLFFARYFYENTHYNSTPFYDFLFNYGIIPAWIISTIAVVVYLLSYVIKAWKKWRPYALLWILVMMIGAGFIIHTVLKDHWGRPRPRQVIEFGGMQPFRAWYEPNFFHQPEPSKSFPCGHCTMAFCFFATAVISKRLGSSTFFYGSIAIAVVFGILMGVTRMAQGGHFLSDVLFTALIMWLTAITAEWMLFPNNRNSPHERPY